MATITAQFGEPIKQYGGEVQVRRSVKVQAPGKHFNNLTNEEAKESYWATAVEYAERHQFERHLRAWGDRHKGPGIRFVCDSDAVDDPNSQGFWTSARPHWRHRALFASRCLA